MRLSSQVTSASVGIGIGIGRKVYAALPFPGIVRPVFIIGCGRSGTTILGTALSKHRDVTYLNEPRHLWLAAYPETDIWSGKAHSRNGKLHLSASDADPRKSRKLARLFRFETIMSGRPILVEKLPINNFRLEFIHEMFPDARFIHIYRNGLEVARSMVKMSDQKRWFGSNDYKWNGLVGYALSHMGTSELPSLCGNSFDRGLLEWRLSIEAAVAFLRDLSDDAYMEIGYGAFVNCPVESMSRIMEFLGIDHDPAVTDFAADTVSRRSRQLGQEEASDKARILGGNFLPLSMDGETGLAKHCA